MHLAAIHIDDITLAKSWLINIVGLTVGFTPEYLQAIDVSLEQYANLATLAFKIIGGATLALNGIITLYKTIKRNGNKPDKKI